LYTPQNISSVNLTTTKYVRRTGWITNRMRSGQTNSQGFAFLSPTPAPPLEWPSQEQLGSDLTACAPVSDVSASACTVQMGYGFLCDLWVWSRWTNRRPCPPMSNPSWTARPNLIWAMRQSNGCSTPALRSSAAKWLQELAQKMKKFRTPMQVDENNGCEVFCEEWFLIAAAWNTAVRQILGKNFQSL